MRRLIRVVGLTERSDEGVVRGVESSCKVEDEAISRFFARASLSRPKMGSSSSGSRGMLKIACCRREPIVSTSASFESREGKEDSEDSGDEGKFLAESSDPKND